jgi:hypothetical protein
MLGFSAFFGYDLLACEDMSLPPLKLLHPAQALLLLKLEQFCRLSTDELIKSLLPGEPGALKVRPDGTIMDGHHRIQVLRERGGSVDALPRERETISKAAWKGKDE